LEKANKMSESHFPPTEDAEKAATGAGRQSSVATLASLDDALESLDISTKDADEAFSYLKDHPNADAVRQEAVAILADPKATKRLLRKIDFTIVPCMIAVYFLQFLWASPSFPHQARTLRVF
jgi:hypothetical protein